MDVGGRVAPGAATERSRVESGTETEKRMESVFSGSLGQRDFGLSNECPSFIFAGQRLFWNNSPIICWEGDQKSYAQNRATARQDVSAFLVLRRVLMVAIAKARPVP